MAHNAWLSRLSLIIAVSTVASTIVACGGGNLPSGLEQTSVTQAAATETYLPLAYSAAKSVFTQGETIQTEVSGGKSPYTFSPSSLVSDSGVFSASTLGTYPITVTDAQGLSQSFTVTVNAVVAPQPVDPTPVTPVVVAPPASQAVYRFFNTLHGLHQHQLVNANDGAYWTPDGEVFRTYVGGGTGLVPLYQCRIDTIAVAFFESQDPNCEGRANVGSVGYVYQTQQSGTTPLYRFSLTYATRWGVLIDHLDLKDPNQAPAGWTNDGVIGYVPN